MNRNILLNKPEAIAMLALILWLSLVTAFGQTQQPPEEQELLPNQSVEREMTGMQTHRYKFELKAGEFFQVRVDQRGVDVTLKLSDPSSNVVATMDSPNSNEGPETLSFVVDKSGNYVMEVSGFDPKAKKGFYAIRRQLPRTATAKDRRRIEVEKCFVAGLTARDVEGQGEIAISKLEEAQVGWQELKEAYLSDLTARQIKELKDAKKRVQADAVFAEARTLANKGVADSMRESLPRFMVARDLYREIEDKHIEAICLVWLGNVHFALAEMQKALEFHNLALPLLRAVGDRGWEATTLNSIAFVYAAVGEKQKALEFHNLALPLFKAVGDRGGEATTLNSIGVVYNAIGEKRKALEFHNLALPLFKAIGDSGGEGLTLTNIGEVYNAIGEKQKALEFHNLALPLFKAVGDSGGEAATLNNIGGVYETLGETQKALEFYTLALPLLRALGDRGKEALSLHNIGAVYFALGQQQKALEFLNLALPLLRAVSDRDGEGGTLNSIGVVYGALGKQQKALEFYDLALPLRRAVGDKSGEAVTLTNIGGIYLALGQQQKALEAYNLALPLRRAVDDRAGEANTLGWLRHTWSSLGNLSLAIFYGKQCVNKYQELRQAIQGLDKETQKTFLSTFQGQYRGLADLLIAEGRIVEAEQVLAMLKQEEVFDYLRRDASETGNLQQRADLRPEERNALKRYDEIADKITTLGAEFGHLQELQSKGAKLTVDQQKRHAELSNQIEAANRSFQVFLRQLAEEFAKRPNTERDVQENLALQSDLRDWGRDVVFLYTLAGDDRYRVILVTSTTQTDGKTEIKAADLNERIQKFRAAVQDPTVDPRSLGKELYDIVIKPIEKQLEGAKAKTLLWSLDGNLRLLPLAALWDGKQYFGRKYQNVTITLASRTRLGDRVEPNWRALGLGVSEAKTVKEPNGTREFSFASLPAVRAELRSIVQTAQSPNGVMPGQSLLDAAFNEVALASQLLQGYKLIHIASHFSLNPGDSTRSFLLLGDGDVLTMDEIKNNPKLSFRGVELLTLSACQTAVVEKDSSGKEIEGFGYIAQQKGAKAILATLWSVADESTQLLMSEFYRLRKANPRLTKAAALQIAQQKMIDGKLKVSDAMNQRRDTSDANMPAHYRHPYYWSPFVLIGNWR